MAEYRRETFQPPASLSVSLSRRDALIVEATKILLERWPKRYRGQGIGTAELLYPKPLARDAAELADAWMDNDREGI